MIDVSQILADMAKMQLRRPEFAKLQNMNPQIIAALIITQAIDRLTDAITQSTSSGRNPPGDAPDEVFDDIRSLVGHTHRLPADPDDTKPAEPDGAPVKPVDEPLR